MAAIPRINGGMMSACGGQVVSIVGRLGERIGGGKIAMETSDKRTIYLSSAGVAIPEKAVIEIIGNVTTDSQISYVDHAVLADDFDMETYNELIAVANGPHKKIFGL